MTTLTAQQLTDASNACTEHETKLRIDVVRMLVAGFIPYQVAAATGVSVSMVRDVERRYKTMGLDGLRDRRKRALRLDDEQKALLAKALKGPPPAGETSWNGASVRRFIAATFDRRVTNRRGRELLAEAS